MKLKIELMEVKDWVKETAKCYMGELENELSDTPKDEYEPRTKAQIFEYVVNGFNESEVQNGVVLNCLWNGTKESDLNELNESGILATMILKIVNEEIKDIRLPIA